MSVTPWVTPLNLLCLTRLLGGVAPIPMRRGTWFNNKRQLARVDGYGGAGRGIGIRATNALCPQFQYRDINAPRWSTMSEGRPTFRCPSPLRLL